MLHELRANSFPSWHPTHVDDVGRVGLTWRRCMYVGAEMPPSTNTGKCSSAHSMAAGRALGARAALAQPLGGLEGVLSPVTARHIAVLMVS